MTGSGPGYRQEVSRRFSVADLPSGIVPRLRPEEVPSWTTPMLATLTEERFSDPGWIFERKFDGIRCLAFRNRAGVRLFSRNHKPLDGAYPEVVDVLAAQECDRFVLDGEIVAFEGRRTSFARLQGRSGVHDQRRARASGIPVYYYVFDLLHLDGYGTTRVPLSERKRLLRSAFHFIDPLRYTTHRVGAGEEAYARACARGDEGVVAKRAGATYSGRRSPDWLKFKCVRDQELVVGGYTAPRGSRTDLGALLVGYQDRGRLVYAGKVGTGFSEATLRQLRDRLDPLRRETSPFAAVTPVPRDVRWVEPRLVAQIGFTEWTRDGKLRHPRYLGLREDKAAADVVRETR